MWFEVAYPNRSNNLLTYNQHMKKEKMSKKMVCSNCKGKGCKSCNKYPDYNEGESMMNKKVGAGSDNRQ